MSMLISVLKDRFEQVLSISVMASVLVCLILIARWMLKDRLHIRWQYWLWMLVILRLVLPWTPESPISLYNLIPIPGIAESSSAYAPQDWNEKHAEPVPIVSSHIDQAPSKSTSANLGDQTNIFASQQ